MRDTLEVKRGEHAMRDTLGVKRGEHAMRDAIYLAPLQCAGQPRVL